MHGNTALQRMRCTNGLKKILCVMKKGWFQLFCCNRKTEQSDSRCDGTSD